MCGSYKTKQLYYHGGLSSYNQVSFRISYNTNSSSLMFPGSGSLVLCPDPTLSQGKGLGDHWAFSWLCRVSSLNSEQANEIVHHTCVEANQWNTCTIEVIIHIFKNQDCWLGKTKEALNSYQYRPFSSWEGGAWAQDYCFSHPQFSLTKSGLRCESLRTSYRLTDCLLTCSLVVISGLQQASQLWKGFWDWARPQLYQACPCLWHGNTTMSIAARTRLVPTLISNNFKGWQFATCRAVWSYVLVANVLEKYEAVHYKIIFIHNNNNREFKNFKHENLTFLERKELRKEWKRITILSEVVCVNKSKCESRNYTV